MHSCPLCDETCYCDGEDRAQPAPHDCFHECDDDEDLYTEEDAP